MSELTVTDFLVPGLMAALIAALWALLVLWPTFQVAKWISYKWLRSIVGTFAFLAVLLGGLAGGAFAWVVYWAGVKKADITAKMYPDGSLTTTEILLDPEFWAILTPIMTPLLVVMLVAIRWKKVGASIGVDWA